MACVLCMCVLSLMAAERSAYNVDPFTINDSSRLSVSVAVTAQRKCIEILHRNGARVLSPLTNYSTHDAIDFFIAGSVTRQKEIVTLDVQLRDGANNIVAQTECRGDSTFWKLVRNSLGEALLYGLTINTQTLRLATMPIQPTSSTAAYALYRAAQIAYRTANVKRSIELLEMAYEHDTLFAMACWSLANLYRMLDETAMVDMWQGRAIQIDPTHPRWRFVEPEMTREIIGDILKSSQRADFQEVVDGIEQKIFSVRKSGFKIAAWRVDPVKRACAIAIQKTSTGARAVDFANNYNALLAINGGFFEMDGERAISPSGLVVVNRKVIHPITDFGGSGVFHIRDAVPKICWAKDFKNPQNYTTAIQCGPLLVEPGGKPGIYSNDYKRVGRTAIGVADGKVILVVVEESEGSGMSLYELSEVLRKPENKGGFGCRVALNLDGGLSSQAYAKIDTNTVRLSGLWAVHNAIIVK